MLSISKLCYVQVTWDVTIKQPNKWFILNLPLPTCQNKETENHVMAKSSTLRLTCSCMLASRTFVSCLANRGKQLSWHWGTMCTAIRGNKLTNEWMRKLMDSWDVRWSLS